MGIDRGPRSDAARREALANAAQRKRTRSGANPEVRTGAYRPRSTTSRKSHRWAILGASVGVVLIIGVLVVPPLAGGIFRAVAEENPDLLRVGLIRDAVAAVMDERPDTPGGTDPTPVDFVVEPGASSRQITEDLVARQLVTDRLAFSYVLASDGTFDELRFGRHTLQRTMTPRQVASALTGEPIVGTPGVTIALRLGLRIEQIVAYLQTLPLGNLDVEAFHALASDPPPATREAFPWLSAVPDGYSVEGFLGSGVFDVPPDIDAQGMLDVLLQRWQDSDAFVLLDSAQADGHDIYQTLILASIVEREAVREDERALIAGVYQNRLDGLAGARLLNADPVLIYAKDTMNLRDLHISEWPGYNFWSPVGLGAAADFQVPDDLAGFQVWHSRGLPPWPICTPRAASIQAALAPDTADGYLYFVAKGDGSGAHAFAHTYEEHLGNIQKYIRGDSPPPTDDPATEEPE